MNILAVTIAAVLVQAEPPHQECFVKADALRATESQGYVLVAGGPTVAHDMMEFYMVPGTEKWTIWFQTPDRQWMCPVAVGEGWRTYHTPRGQGS